MAHVEEAAALSALADEELVGLCREGHERAWKALVHRYKRLVYAIPLRAGLDEDDVEEVFQDAFVKLAEKIGSIRDGARVRAWIVTTVRHLTIDTIRARKTSRGLHGTEIALEQVADQSELVSQSVERREEHEFVRRALQRLDPRSRRLLSLLFFARDERPSYQAISKELGIPTGSIGPTRARCLRKLRLEYQRIAGQPDEMITLPFFRNECLESLGERAVA
jgi:RNA polymerase sigma factor (sigma-70 family)